MQKDLSIITVTWNCGESLDKTLNSVKKLVETSSLSIESIIIDGFSSDNTEKVAAKYNFAEFIQKPPNGICNAFNEAIDNYCNGKYLWFLNAGDEVFSDLDIEEFDKFLIENINSDNLLVFSVALEEFQRRIYKPGFTNESSLKTKALAVHHQGTFIPSKHFKKYGNYDESVVLRGDFDHFLRIFSGGESFKQTNLVISTYEGGGGTAMMKNAVKSSLEAYSLEKKYKALDGNTLLKAYLMGYRNIIIRAIFLSLQKLRMVWLIKLLRDIFSARTKKL
tara:strand:+ start:4869 stop:5702 length:834 start_codon:yes stop_codon:yes gene_type:complete